VTRFGHARATDAPPRLALTAWPGIAIADERG